MSSKTLDRTERMIHDAAHVSDDVQLGKGVRIGPFAVIESGVVIGDNTTVGAHCVIGSDTRIGADNILHPFSSIGGGFTK